MVSSYKNLTKSKFKFFPLEIDLATKDPVMVNGGGLKVLGMEKCKC